MATMETLKSIIAWAISPVIITLLIQLVGWLLWLFKKRKPAIVLLGLGTAALLIGGLPVLSFHTNRAREFEHAPLVPGTGLEQGQPVLAVVLGTGFNPDPELPPNSRIGGAFLARLVEGVRIHRNLPNSRLLVSVANADADPAAKREFLAAMTTLLALDPERVDLITEAESTADEARLATGHHRPGEQVVVVTSAGHMPRAMKIFADAGLAPTAAPCDFQYPRSGSPEDKPWQRWIPSGEGTGGTRQLLYEALASLAR